MAVNHTNPGALPAGGKTLCELSHGPQRVAKDEFRAPRTQFFLHPTGSSSDARDGQSRVRVVWQSKKSRHEDVNALMPPASRCLGHAHHCRTARLSIPRHARERVHDLHVVPHILEEFDVVFNKDAPCWIERDGIEKTHHEDSDGTAPSIERLMNLCEVVRNVRSVVEQA